MKWILLSIFSVILFFMFSCNQNYVSIKQYVKNADSATIAFYSNSDSNTHIIIRDKASIEKLGGYLEGKTTEPLKCSDNGSIWFYEGGKKTMQVDFSLNNDCNFFSYMMNDKIYTKTMGDDALNYLTSIEAIASDGL